jgi:FkbM family methyltransferase
LFAYDYISTQIILDGIYERDELELLTQWLSSFAFSNMFNGLAVDVGANVGNHSLYLSGFFSEVLAFEPHPLTYKLLSINTEVAGNVTCFNCGLSNFETPASMLVGGRNMGEARVARTGNSTEPQVQLKTLDSILKEAVSKPIRLIKIDVEGHESEVIAGAEATIKEYQPIILFEQHVFDFYDGTSNAIELLRSYGYQNFACIEKFPRLSTKLPHLLHLACAVVAQLLVGSSHRIVSVNVFEPKFYPFLIALPSCLPTTMRRTSGTP